MADTMKVFCPHCLNEFDVNVDAGEEVLNPTATITRHSSMRASWSDIAAEIRSGHGYRVLGQDDIITFTLKNGEQAAVQVVAVDHYERNSMLFAFVDCPTESVMNDRNTNAGGWHDSKMRKKLNEDFIKLLPDDLVEVIKPRTITQILGGSLINMIGDNIEMNVELITPIAMEEGLRFAIREGGRTVGSGVVAKIVE